MSKKAQAGNLWVDPGAEDDCRYEIGGARELCLPNWKFRSLMSAAQNLNDGISGFIVKEASTCWPMKTAFYFNLRLKDREQGREVPAVSESEDCASRDPVLLTRAQSRKMPQPHGNGSAFLRWVS